MGAKTERLILAFSFGDVSLRALHQARVCISRVAIENTTTTFTTFIPPRGASRWRAAPRWRESLAPANRAARLHCATRDPAATAGSRTSPRRLGHSTAPSASRRCSPRVSALPDILCAGWPCVGGGGAQGCASARGLRRGFGGLTGGLRAARLMAGPLWWPAPDVTMRLLCRDFGAKPCRRVGPRGSYVACCVHRVCTA